MSEDESEKSDFRKPLRCIACDKQPDSCFGDHEDDATARQPYAATAFTTYGHYGSTVFDPMGGVFLEVNICDDCLKVAIERNVILLGSRHHRPDPEVAYEPWVIGENDG